MKKWNLKENSAKKVCSQIGYHCGKLDLNPTRNHGNQYRWYPTWGLRELWCLSHSHPSLTEGCSWGNIKRLATRSGKARQGLPAKVRPCALKRQRWGVGWDCNSLPNGLPTSTFPLSILTRHFLRAATVLFIFMFLAFSNRAWLRKEAWGVLNEWVSEKIRNRMEWPWG